MPPSTTLTAYPKCRSLRAHRRNDPTSRMLLGKGRAVSLSPDGKWALSLIPGSPERLTLLSMGIGSERVLLAGPISHYAFARWFPDGGRILVVGRAAEKANRCYVQDANGGESRCRSTSGGTIGFLVSPDATKLLTHNSGAAWTWAWTKCGSSDSWDND